MQAFRIGFGIGIRIRIWVNIKIGGVYKEVVIHGHRARKTTHIPVLTVYDPTVSLFFDVYDIYAIIYAFRIWGFKVCFGDAQGLAVKVSCKGEPINAVVRKWVVIYILMQGLQSPVWGGSRSVFSVKDDEIAGIKAAVFFASYHYG